MRFFEKFFSYSCSWEDLLSVFWSRYPTPFSKHVLSEDTLERKVLPDGRLYTKRLLTKTNKGLPRWAERFITGPRVVPAIEEVIIDKDSSKITSYVGNIYGRRVLAVDERCEFTADGVVKEVSCKRQAWCSSNIYGLIMAIEKFALDRYKKNCEISHNGILYVLDRRRKQLNGESDSTTFPDDDHPEATSLLSKAERIQLARKNLKDKAKNKANQLKHMQQTAKAKSTS